jgi:hypothetical protein
VNGRVLGGGKLAFADNGANPLDFLREGAPVDELCGGSGQLNAEKNFGPVNKPEMNKLKSRCA